MAQATRQKRNAAPVLSDSLVRAAREAAFIGLLAIAAFLLLSFSSYDPADPGWSFSGTHGATLNHGGAVGSWLADVFLYLFGFMAYLFPMMIAWGGFFLFHDVSNQGEVPWTHVVTRGLGFALTLTSGAALLAMHVSASVELPLGAGGVLGTLVGTSLTKVCNFVGATLVSFAGFLTGFTLFTGMSWIFVAETTGAWAFKLSHFLSFVPGQVRDWLAARRARKERVERVEVQRKARKRKKPPRIEPVVSPAEPSKRVEKEKQVPLFDEMEGELPPLALLDDPQPTTTPISEASLDGMSRQVELKLQDYGIEAEVVAVHPGPVVTRFELQLAAGVKVSRVSSLSKDLARSLSTVSVRIVEVIQGKSVIGLEVPNEQVEVVYLSEIMRSSAYDDSASMLSLGLGKDVAGVPVVVDLQRMPHLLVAGTTGSGKSVAINAMILSLLYKATANDVRLIMVDPKMLELSVYEGIPHLLAPVVTDMKDAANALRWCVAEMERRYRLMSQLGVRNIAGFNRKVKEANDKGQPIADPFFVSQPDPVTGQLGEPRTLEHMPFIVVVIDELADLMMVVGKKIDELIARLAQKARASGIHLILATQRPSVDVITGLIKANIPSRIAFQVSSKIDSRTILDQGGADQLLGHGDMLYLTPGMPTPSRVHGAFVSDQEVHRIVGALKKSGEPQYVDEILSGDAEITDPVLQGITLDTDDTESDPLYDEAVQIVLDTRRASVSGIQRRLKIGYNRAARLVEQMEQVGMVGPLQSNGSREILVPGGD